MGSPHWSSGGLRRLLPVEPNLLLSGDFVPPGARRRPCRKFHGNERVAGSSPHWAPQNPANRGVSFCLSLLSQFRTKMATVLATGTTASVAKVPLCLRKLLKRPPDCAWRGC